MAGLTLGGVGFFFGRGAPGNIGQRTYVSPASTSPISSTFLPEIAEGAHTETSKSPPITSWEDRWHDVSKKPSTPPRDRDLAALLEALARSDPQGALGRAGAEGNWRLREILRDASLRGWASVAPEAAGEWALRLRVEDRRDAVSAVLSGASKNPEQALHLALQLCRADPGPAGDYGHAAIAALVQAGAFETAAKFGEQVGSDKFPFLIKSAFYQWSQHQPDQALTATNDIHDPLLRGQVYAEVVSGWARADPKSLAEYAMTLPAGDSRKAALAEALPRWVEKEPATATEWINRFDAGPDFDEGAAAVANLQTLITRQPAKAMEWAGTISDPAKRSETLQSVFGQWAQKDPAAARRFVETTTDPRDRRLLTRALDEASPKS